MIILYVYYRRYSYTASTMPSIRDDLTKRFGVHWPAKQTKSSCAQSRGGAPGDIMHWPVSRLHALTLPESARFPWQPGAEPGHSTFAHLSVSRVAAGVGRGVGCGSKPPPVQVFVGQPMVQPQSSFFAASLTQVEPGSSGWLAHGGTSGHGPPHTGSPPPVVPHAPEAGLAVRNV